MKAYFYGPVSHVSGFKWEMFTNEPWPWYHESFVLAERDEGEAVRRFNTFVRRFVRR